MLFQQHWRSLLAHIILPLRPVAFPWEHSDQARFTAMHRDLLHHARVLKPGGKFLFLEHGLSPEPGVQKWQRRLNWLEMRLADGCRLERDIKALVAAQPFSSVEVEEFYLQGTPKTHGYLYRGVATK